MEVLPPEGQPDKMKNLKEFTTVIYALHAASFFVFVTLIIALVLNYVKKDEVKGTYLESHFREQIKTAWIVIIVGFVGVITIPLLFLGVLILIILSIWFIIRIVSGWVKLNDEKAIS